MARRRVREPGVYLGRLRRVRIMNGVPPVVLTWERGKAVNSDDLLDWVGAVRKYFLERGEFLELEGLLYWIDWYWLDSLEKPEVFEKVERFMHDHVESWEEFSRRHAG